MCIEIQETERNIIAKSLKITLKIKNIFLDLGKNFKEAIINK